MHVYFGRLSSRFVAFSLYYPAAVYYSNTECRFSFPPLEGFWNSSRCNLASKIHVYILSVPGDRFLAAGFCVTNSIRARNASVALIIFRLTAVRNWIIVIPHFVVHWFAKQINVFFGKSLYWQTGVLLLLFVLIVNITRPKDGYRCAMYALKFLSCHCATQCKSAHAWWP